jgi:two-component system sensor histidine kinase HydH
MSTPPRDVPTAPREFDLLRWFSRASLAAAIVVSVLLAFGLTRVVDSLLLRHDAEVGRQFVQSLAETTSASRHLSDTDDAGRQAVLATFLARVAALPDVLRANLYDRSGVVVWSSDAAMIGRHYEDNDELEASLRGETIVERGPLETGDKAEHVALGHPGTHYVESYLPLYETGPAAAQPRRVIWIVELYRVPTELNATLRDAAFAVWTGAFLGGLLLYVALLGVVRKANGQLQAQRERLVEAESMARAGEIAASVAHSIRNPLASIRSTAELQLELGEPHPEASRETIAQVDRIEHLIRALLTYVQQSAEVRGRTPVAPLMRSVKERFESSFQAQGKTLQVRIEPALPDVRGEEIAIAQVLHSLLSNALEATRAGDRVTLAASHAGPMVQLEVCDPGIGIAASRMAEIFKPFATTKPRGLGMGLALARRTLDRLGGRIELTSGAGQTCARVQLPVATDVDTEGA